MTVITVKDLYNEVLWNKERCQIDEVDSDGNVIAQTGIDRIEFMDKYIRDSDYQVQFIEPSMCEGKVYLKIRVTKK